MAIQDVTARGEPSKRVTGPYWSPMTRRPCCDILLPSLPRRRVQAWNKTGLTSHRTGLDTQTRERLTMPWWLGSRRRVLLVILGLLAVLDLGRSVYARLGYARPTEIWQPAP